MVQSNDITAVCVLAIKGPTGVTLEVNLRNPLHTGEEACKREGSTLALNSREGITRSPKQEYEWSHKKD